MTTRHDQVIQDEADAEKRQREYDKRHVKGKAEKEVPVERRKEFDLSPLAADAPMPAATMLVQASAVDPETKKLFEALIVEIRKQIAGGGGGGTGGTTNLSSVVTDLNSLRDSIMLTNASLDADAGVATTTFAANGDPPPITTVA
jgi:hypothetical protein